jgi:hypothetical protein
MMGWHPKQPIKGPTYNGPSNAEQFAEDMAARRALKRHDLPCPPQLSHESIIARYAFVSMDRNDAGIPCRATFLDGSVVAMSDRGSWTVER